MRPGLSCILFLLISSAGWGCTPQASSNETGPADTWPQDTTVDGQDSMGSSKVGQIPPSLVDAAHLLSQEGTKGEAFVMLRHLTDTFGPRLSGSKALEGAIDWSLAEMERVGLKNVRREKVMVPHWVRGEEWAKVVAPIERELVVLGIGGTVGTGQPMRGELVVVDSLEEVSKAGDSLKGRIVLINARMAPFDQKTGETHYRDAARARFYGAAHGAKAGAVAVLVRSATARSLRTPHTGSLGYEEGVTKIPGATVTVEDAELLARLAEAGGVEVELFIQAETLPDAVSGNAIGEIRGRELPDEVVVVGAHIDSWDVGTGANDDGAGCVMVLEAARLLTSLRLSPRRTLRFVLFTNEENGMRGAKGYYAAHKQDHHAAAIESDMGAGRPRGFRVKGTKAQLNALIGYAPLFTKLNADHIQEGFAGVDIRPLTDTGVLGVGLHPDVSTYFDTHHTPADTIDKIDPEFLQQNAAAFALMAFILAER